MSLMTADVIVEDEASLEDVRHSAQLAMARAGVTEADLREQARTGDFESLDARLAWVVLATLPPS